MVPKKADWNRVIPMGDGRCPICHGRKKDPRWGDERTCEECRGSGRCRMCDGTGKTLRDKYHCQYCNNNYGSAEKQYYRMVGRKTSIDELLREISENELARRVWKRCDAARESSLLDRNTVASRAEFEAVISQFWAHYAPRANFHDYMNPENPFLTAEHFLEEIYGSTRIPYECARSGESGGIRSICNALHERAKAHLTEHVVKATLDYFQMPERERLLREYLEKYGHLGKYKGQTAIQLLLNFSEVIAYHSSVVQPSFRAAAERA